MMIIQNYKIVTHSEKAKFEIEVAKSLKEGWQPFGNFGYAVDIGLFQAMVKYNYESGVLENSVDEISVALMQIRDVVKKMAKGQS